MREVTLGLIVLATSLQLCAQQPPKVELFGGYSLIHRSSDTMNGWDSAVTTNVNSWFGITADVSGHYVSQTVFVGPPPGILGGSADVHAHSFTFGPRLSYRKSRYTLFAHTLLGVTHLSSTVQIQNLTPSTFSSSANAFTTLFGGGIDIGIGHHIAIRPAQPEYLLLRTSSGINVNQFRYSAGVVFQFGQR